MAPDIQKTTMQWMEQHQVREILEVLTAQLMYHKPEDPTAFLIEQLQTMRAQGAKSLLEDSDLETMFGMFDITRTGQLTKQQAYRALRTILGPQHPLVESRSADRDDAVGKLTRDEFVKSISEALRAAAPAVALG